jgi:hypothetical protein
MKTANAITIDNSDSRYAGSGHRSCGGPIADELSLVSQGARTGGISCYFNSYQECRATLSGLGGWCMRSPYFRGLDRQ